MRIAELLGRSRPTISFEFMAPRDESEVEVLERTIAALAGHAPDWVSVTYRLRTGEKTLDLVTRIKRQYHIEAMAHLTCANSADRTRQILNWMEREGVANVLALRGDPQESDERFVPAGPELAHGSDLVAFVRRNGYGFGIGAACSTEKHPESPDLEHEFQYMKLKVDSGADFLVTQLFFDNQFYFNLVARARAAGIKVPIEPGLMPVPSRRSLAHMARPCRRRCSKRSTSSRTTTRYAGSAFNTASHSAQSCSRPECPACTSIRSIARRRRSRSWLRCEANS